MPYASYKIGDEIKGFPVDGISITVTNWSVSPDLTFPRTSSDTILNVAIRNMANLDVYFNQTDLQTKLDQAANKQLYLTLKTEKGSGATGAWNSTYWWGITVLGVPRNEFNSMAANESVNGSIRFVIGNNNYSSFQLLCESASQRKPLFIVNLAQG